MNEMPIIPIIIISITCIFSFKGFKDLVFFDKYKFNISSVLKDKEYYRFVSSGFLHADIIHLMFNMYTLYSFSEFIIGVNNFFFLIVYFGSIIFGSIISFIINRKKPYYSSIGASGGVCGILFACILIFPTIQVGIFPIPFPIPGWIFALIYLGYSIYGMKKQFGNIGHEAHLGGATFGMVVSILYSIIFGIQINYLYLGIMMALIAIISVFLIMEIRK